MWIFDWFWNTLSALGLYQKKAKLVFLGLDNAGKSTLMAMLRDNYLHAFMPTQKPTMEELTLGGHEMARRIWREYYAVDIGVVFLVDSAAPLRFNESRLELTNLLMDESLQHVPFLILGNKCDLAEAVSETELRKQMACEQTYGKAIDPGALIAGVRPIEVFSCSVVKRMGYAEGFQWLAQPIK